MTEQHIPQVVFVCVKNGGKSQMAAALMRQIAGDSIRVLSAGTQPGGELNALSVESLSAVGASTEGEYPKQLTTEMLQSADVVVVLGQEAEVAAGPETKVERWDTDEPSLRGIEGRERMDLVRDDIARHVRALARELVGTR